MHPVKGELNRRRFKFISLMKADFVRCRDVRYLHEIRVGKDGMRTINSDRKGQIIRDVTIPNNRPRKPKRGLVSLTDSVDIPHYRERVSKLSYLSHVVAENGLCKEAFRDVKRLYKVCFTTHIVNLRKLIRRITRKCYGPFAANRLTRSPSVSTKLLRKYPTLTGETKTHRQVGITVPLWTVPKPLKALIGDYSSDC
ncbi:hypothetical protein 2 [Cryphonectria naterciae splipalmivirus 1]|uniref:Uncharacterized protein n=1 Tax=Cryphonectria naterciae splipalmivirus 1 TaxID=2841740 RepID=A0AAD1NTV7_9VIRU|nr:hypothetical protein 2 [Cryphonectria naterciae splipalmivirus 1]